MNKQFLLTLFFISSIVTILSAQLAPDFTLTDSNGGVHRLYQDYLDQGKVVVLKIFFVNCPPCNAIAPAVQQKYVEWGSGSNGVQFIEISDKVTDHNGLINGYKANHGITFPSIGSEGGGPAAAQPYKASTFGQWYGTPTLLVIAPNGTVDFNVDLEEINASITAAQQIVAPQPTAVQILANFPGNSLPAGVSIVMHPDNASSPMINLTEVTNGSYQFEYPSTMVPEMTNPTISLISTAGAKSAQISAVDLVAIRKHILALQKFTDERELIAADVNRDGKISVIDLTSIQKVILGLHLNFPNGTPSYVLYPSEIALNVPAGGGGNIVIDLEVLKMGNVK